MLRILACAALTLALVPASSSGAKPPRERAPRVIVKLASEGAHAVEACAQEVFERSGRFEQVSADGSDSLDRLHARHGVQHVRALFRRADGRPLREQRAALRKRLSRRSPRRVRGVRAATPSAADTAPDLSHIYVVQAGGDTDVESLLESYANDPHVAWVQRDHAHTLDATPNDPFFLSSGAWGQEYLDLWGLHRIRAPEAWSLSRGEGVVVAIVDTGIDYHHPDIADNVWVNPGEDLDGNGRVDASDWNGVDDDGNGFIDDLNGFDFANSVDADGDGRYDGPDDISDSDPWDDRGHGTHIAGTIAAVADNGIGIVGVAPGAKVMAIKGFGASGPGLDSLLWRGVLYAAANGATVVNNSWSCGVPCPHNPLAEEVVTMLSAQGVVIVTSAGNRSRDIVHNSPENMRELITVGSSDERDEPSASFTNFGWVVDLAAPGGGPSSSGGPPVSRRNILSLSSTGLVEAEQPFRVEDEYLRWAGTSMSAPHVAGVVALLQSAYPGLGYEAIRRILRESAVDTGAEGFDYAMGAGRLDALAALEHGAPSDLNARIDSPRPRAIFSPDSGTVEVRGQASGAALRAWSLSYGKGSAPTSWVPIVEAATPTPQAGLLAQWDVSDLGQGAFVLKLEVHGTNGELYEEHVQLSLERAQFVQLSSFGPPASRPSLSGDRVVWHSERDPAMQDGEAEDPNLFATRLSSGEEWALQVAPGVQEQAHLSGDIVTWLDDRAEDQNESDIYACKLRGRDGRCDAVPIVSGPYIKLTPGVVGRHVIWQQAFAGKSGLASCRMARDGRSCEPSSLGLSEGVRFLLGVSERQIAWYDQALGRTIATCEIDPISGACPVRSFDESIFPAGPPVVSGSLVAYERQFFSGNDLYVCELDPSTGACPEVRIRRDVVDDTPRLSGNRLVWHDAPRDQASDVYLCEYDALRRRCPVQRITAEFSAQIHADVSGDWVVWEDHRLGAAQIFGIQLPKLRPLPDVRIQEGSALRLPIRAVHGGGASLHLTLEVAGDLDAEALGIELVDSGRGRGMLQWRPDFDQAGDYVVTVAASAESGLVTRQSIRLEVREANARPRVVIDSPGAVAVGSAAVLDACGSDDADGDDLSFVWEALPLHVQGRRHGKGGAGGEVVGNDCRLELAAVERISFRRFELRVSDGIVEVRRRAAVAWLPAHWLRWWRAAHRYAR